MDNRPIGIFDSGVGGLTAVPHIMRQLPKERLIYFGDTARTPYGSKAKSTITSFTRQIVDFLLHKDVKMLVIACNTITATCLDELPAYCKGVPVIGIIEPAARKVAREHDISNRIGIIGTKVTIQQKTYIKNITKYNPDLKLFDRACPIFVPLIEEGIIDHGIMELSVKHYLDEFVEENALDTLVLGCTHYPLIQPTIEKLYPHLKIIDPSFEIVHSIHKALVEGNLLAENPEAENIFYASDLSENFMNMINSIFGKESVKVDFKNFDLDILECK
ncbi:glutamate racemase [Geosporobacter subterraneus DSM 17957]|uniref:Glutamate racemase n=1 Tax=Geosporobacter subterraneus DSM 17957 TaxID=1121919 RepID=A0A1M6FW81_9FIRM|nr:glutamate racemase [Geosporobacter subterraneus]SHJ01956.1 glutamate racemase [Geosporobacter subterraneus DSM 17957]